MSRIVVKTLTGSDLTLFGRQRGGHWGEGQNYLDLIADVFVGQLYPTLLKSTFGRSGRVPIDLCLYGPGNAQMCNHQRKLIGDGLHTQWRLGGESVPNPLDSPTRFDALEAGDFAIFDFDGELYPTAARVVFVARGVPQDVALHRGLADAGIGSMAAMELPQLRLIVHAAGVPESHPVFELLLDAAIEDAAQGGIEGIRKLLARQSGRRMTRSELERARQRADDVGRMGEELLDGYFAAQQTAGLIERYEWVAAENAISPFDFLVSAGGDLKVEAKSTCGPFAQTLHMSVAQLMEVRADPAYAVYRLYSLDDHAAKLRIAAGLQGFAEGVLRQFDGLPDGVTADSVSVRPETLPFGDETEIHLTSPDEHEAADA